MFPNAIMNMIEICANKTKLGFTLQQKIVKTITKNRCVSR